jgi:uncharacterized protein (UPF0147 family)
VDLFLQTWKSDSFQLLLLCLDCETNVASKMQETLDEMHGTLDAIVIDMQLSRNLKADLSADKERFCKDLQVFKIRVDEELSNLDTEASKIKRRAQDLKRKFLGEVQGDKDDGHSKRLPQSYSR